MDQGVRDGERDGTGSEVSMGVVDEPKEVRDGERDTVLPVQKSAWHKTNEEELESILDMMGPLPGVISDLLRQQQQHGGRRLTAAVDRTLRRWQFIELELSSIVATLRELLLLLPDLAPDFLDSDRRMADWIGQTLYCLANLIGERLYGTDRPRAAFGCSRRQAWLSNDADYFDSI